MTVKIFEATSTTTAPRWDYYYKASKNCVFLQVAVEGVPGTLRRLDCARPCSPRPPPAESRASPELQFQIGNCHAWIRSPNRCVLMMQDSTSLLLLRTLLLMRVALVVATDVVGGDTCCCRSHLRRRRRAAIAVAHGIDPLRRPSAAGTYIACTKP